MSEQTTIQIRVDNELKEKACDVFEAIGIDMPTAVRMFFKAAIREISTEGEGRARRYLLTEGQK